MEENISEQRLRKIIREGAHMIIEKKNKEKKELFLEERRLRKVIKHLLRETATPDNDPTPHSLTGINVLEDLLKKIIPILEIDFKKLTSSDEQRSSFRSHIVKAVEDTLAPQKAVDAIDSPEKAKMLPVGEQDLDINIGGEENKFIDIEEPKKEIPDEPEDPRDTFGISGTDLTGRNVAFESFKKIESNILDAYDLLSSPEDNDVFYDYLITNLKLYFDKFENDMGVVSEPTTDAYEDTNIPEPDSAELEQPVI